MIGDVTGWTLHHQAIQSPYLKPWEGLVAAPNGAETPKLLLEWAESPIIGHITRE
jgi:hypothetical protein